MALESAFPPETTPLPKPRPRVLRFLARLLRLVGRILWRGKIGPAFWNFAAVVSLGVNLVLLVALILVGRQLFLLKTTIAQPLVAGLHENFVKMDRARIVTTVQVDDTIPVVFDLPVQTETSVVLTKDTRIQNARVNLSTGGLTIANAPANIVLPAGTELPVILDIVVPVNTTVPVKLTVPVDIPLRMTDLHEPFVGLQNVVAPYHELLASAPDSWQATPACRPELDWLCSWLIEETE